MVLTELGHRITNALRSLSHASSINEEVDILKSHFETLIELN